MSDLADQINALVQQAHLPPKELKSVLREAIRLAWPDMPPWTTLENGPLIEEVQKATVGSGAVLTFVEGGVRKVVLAQAGEHYRKKDGTLPESYMIAGGFINLTSTPGSTQVPPSNQPEDPTIGSAREIEEELKTAEGPPLLSVDPERLELMNIKTLSLGDEKRLVTGQALELTPDEITLVKAHVERMACDSAYKAAVSAQSANHESGKPEVADVKIFTLAEAARGGVPLLHADQLSLFQAIEKHFAKIDALTAIPRAEPTRAYQRKVRTLEELAEIVAARRAQRSLTVGVTSGVFDIVHPGHISFLEDASLQCDFLVAIIASDRTVREAKGPEKPYISEEKRAQTIAALGNVDAVIISDEKYHETILRALGPDIMFKGDDYAGQQIMGGDLVGRVVLIPCAEKEFYSSREFVRKIKTGGDQPQTPASGPS